MTHEQLEQFAKDANDDVIWKAGEDEESLLEDN